MTTGEAFVQIVPRPEEAYGFEAAVLRHPLVRRCHATTGDGDHLIQLVAQTLEIKSGHRLAEAARAGGAATP